MGGNAGDVDDASATAPGHVRPEFLAGQQHASDQILVKVRAPVFEADALKGVLTPGCDFRVVATGGVDQNRRCPESGLDRGVCCRQAVTRKGVRREEGRLSTL